MSFRVHFCLEDPNQKLSSVLRVPHIHVLLSVRTHCLSLSITSIICGRAARRQHKENDIAMDLMLQICTSL